MATNEMFAHETAIIEDQASVGEGTKIWHHSHVRSTATIGKNCNLGKNVYIDSNVKIGTNVKIQNNVSVYDGVIVEDDVFLGPSVVFTNDLRPRSFLWSGERRENTLVCKGASIGANATIVCGDRRIGNYSLVGAGSVVIKDVPDHALVVGNPARVIGYVCKCAGRLKKITEKEGILELECTEPKCPYDEVITVQLDE